MDNELNREIDTITKNVINFINKQSLDSHEDQKWAFQLNKFILRNTDNSNELIKACK